MLSLVFVVDLRQNPSDSGVCMWSLSLFQCGYALVCGESSALTRGVSKRPPLEILAYFATRPSIVKSVLNSVVARLLQG